MAGLGLSGGHFGLHGHEPVNHVVQGPHHRVEIVGNEGAQALAVALLQQADQLVVRGFGAQKQGLGFSDQRLLLRYQVRGSIACPSQAGFAPGAVKLGQACGGVEAAVADLLNHPGHGAHVGIGHDAQLQERQHTVCVDRVHRERHASQLDKRKHGGRRHQGQQQCDQKCQPRADAEGGHDGSYTAGSALRRRMFHSTATSKRAAD